MEMIDTHNFDKIEKGWVVHLLGLLLSFVLAVVFAMADEIPLYGKLFMPILIILYIYQIFRYRCFFLFNYDEFHFYEIDMLRKRIKQHKYAKWNEIKCFDYHYGRFSKTCHIIYKNHKYKDIVIENIHMEFYEKDIEKYSKRNDIFWTKIKRYKKRKPFEKYW